MNTSRPTAPESSEAERNTRSVLWGVCLLLGGIACGGLVVGGHMLYKRLMFAKALAEAAPVNERPFDAALWQQPQEVEYGRTTRSEMVENLLTKYSFVGWTRKDVEDLLGPSEAPPDWDDYWDFVYYMGCDRSFLPIDNEWLGFVLDADGHVKEVHTFVD